jgi:hypothetical protein
MKQLFAGAVLSILVACAPATSAEVSWGPGPWYRYCTWDTPCWYPNNNAFVYGWGYIDRPTYSYLEAHPERRDGWSERRQNWHPHDRPAYRGRDRDWDAYQRNNNGNTTRHPGGE